MIKEKTQNIKSSNQVNLKNQGSDIMKQDWEIKKLGEVVDIINGRNQSAVISDNGQYPIYGSAGNLMGLATDYLCEEGTTIIGRKGNISNPIYIEEKFWNVDTAFGLYPKNGYSTKFINYLCQTIDFKSRNRGTTIPSLVKSDLLTIDIPFISSLPEQQRIVYILDECFAAIAKAKANAEQNLKNAKELFESVLNSLIIDDGKLKMEKLGDVCEIKGRIGYRGYTVQDLVQKGEGAITLSPSNIQDNKFITDKCTYISWFKYEESPEIMVFEGDILFVKTGSTYGKVALVENLPEKATINPQFVVLKDIKCSNRFLYFALTTKAFKEKVENIVGGAATPTLSQTNLAEQTIPLPPLKEQLTIVRQLDALRAETKRLEAIYQQKLLNLEELKKSILQKAFAGELRGGVLAKPAEATAPKTEKAKIIKS